MLHRRTFLAAAEPSVTQAILNEVARTGFSTEAGYLIDQLSAGVPLGESLFGIDSRKIVSFNTMFQKKLFPSVAFSMANNPWAQALAAGGLWMVGIFAVAFTSLLVALNVLFRATSGAERAAHVGECTSGNDGGGDGDARSRCRSDGERGRCRGEGASAVQGRHRTMERAGGQARFVMTRDEAKIELGDPRALDIP